MVHTKTGSQCVYEPLFLSSARQAMRKQGTAPEQIMRDRESTALFWSLNRRNELVCKHPSFVFQVRMSELEGYLHISFKTIESILVIT